MFDRHYVGFVLGGTGTTGRHYADAPPAAVFRSRRFDTRLHSTRNFPLRTSYFALLRLLIERIRWCANRAGRYHRNFSRSNKLGETNAVRRIARRPPALRWRVRRDLDL